MKCLMALILFATSFLSSFSFADEVLILRCSEILNGRTDENALLKLISIEEPFEIRTEDGDFGQGEDDLLRSYLATGILKLQYVGQSPYPDRLLDETEDNGHILPPGSVLISPVTVYSIAYASGERFSTEEHSAERFENGNIHIEDQSDYREELQYLKTVSYNAQTHLLSLKISRDDEDEIIVSAKLHCTEL